MAIFPTAVSTDSDLYIAVNTVSTQLTDNPLTIGATTVNVVDASAFPSVGYLSIDNEIIKYAAKTTSSFTGCTRSADGSTALAHVQNSQVFHNIIAAHHNALKEEIKAIEQNLSDRIGLGSTQVKLTDGTVSLPSLTFASDLDTGLFRVAANRFALVVGGVSAWQVDSTAQWFTDVATATIRGADGSAALPAYSFNADTDTGIFRVGANRFALVTGGVSAWQVDSTAKWFSDTGTAKVHNSDGSAADPAYSFNSDPDTGIYREAENILSFASNGVKVSSFQSGASIGAGETVLTLFCSANTNAVRHVVLGAADSAGAGFRTMRVAN